MQAARAGPPGVEGVRAAGFGSSRQAVRDRTLDERTFISVVIPAVSAKAARPGVAPAAPATLPTREAILDAAERLFSAHGVDGVAVRDLPVSSGSPPRACTTTFPASRRSTRLSSNVALRPIVELTQASWAQGEVRRDTVAATVDALVAHLAQHPYLARLLQRALLEETSTVQDLQQRVPGARRPRPPGPAPVGRDLALVPLVLLPVMYPA